MQTPNQILERAAALNWPLVVVGAGPVATEAAWRREAGFPGNLPTLAAQLEEQEARAAAAADRDRRYAVEDAERAAALEPDEAAANQFRIEAEAERQEFVAARPERMEDKLTEAVAVLRTIADRLAR